MPERNNRTDQVVTIDRTHVVALRPPVEALRRQYAEQGKECARVFEEPDSSDAEKRKSLLNYHLAGVEWWNAIAQLITDSDILGAHGHKPWIKALADDCVSCLEVIEVHNKALRERAREVGVVYEVSYAPNVDAYRRLQRLVTKWLPTEAVRLKNRYELEGLPVDGFAISPEIEVVGEEEKGKGSTGDVMVAPGLIPQPLSALKYAVLALVALLIVIGGFVGLVAAGERIQALGLTGNAFYILLVPLGISAAFALFGAMKSYATYSGKMLSGALEVGGPIVAALIVGAGAYVVAPVATLFTLTVRVVQADGNSPIQSGTVRIVFPYSMPSGYVTQNGEAQIADIPSVYRHRKARVRLEAPGYELVDPKQEYDLESASIEIVGRSTASPPPLPPNPCATKPMFDLGGATYQVGTGRSLPEADAEVTRLKTLFASSDLDYRWSQVLSKTQAPSGPVPYLLRVKDVTVPAGQALCHWLHECKNTKEACLLIQ